MHIVPDGADLRYKSVPINNNSLFTNVLRLFYYKTLIVVIHLIVCGKKSKPPGI